MALPTDNTFSNLGNPAVSVPSGPVALTSALDANFACCAPLLTNTTYYTVSSAPAVAVANIATANGAANSTLSNIGTIPYSAQLAILNQFISSGAAAAAGFILA